VGVALGSWVPLMKMGEKRRKTKRKCKNSLQFMDLMCVARKCISSNFSCCMYFRCTKQKECRFLRWGYKVCTSQQESRQMFLVSICICFYFFFFFFFFFITSSQISSQFCFYISSSSSIEEKGSCKV
jgi:heme O synthase-like polyprenyltransferase